MPYPNQPVDIGDQAWRVAENPTYQISRFGLGSTLKDQEYIAQMLETEYGKVPDGNLVYRWSQLIKQMEALKAEMVAQIGMYHPEKTSGGGK